eukprot:3070365-Amphidinium_carterae.1
MDDSNTSTRPTRWRSIFWISNTSGLGTAPFAAALGLRLALAEPCRLSPPKELPNPLAGLAPCNKWTGGCLGSSASACACSALGCSSATGWTSRDTMQEHQLPAKPPHRAVQTRRRVVTFVAGKHTFNLHHESTSQGAQTRTYPTGNFDELKHVATSGNNGLGR